MAGAGGGGETRRGNGQIARVSGTYVINLATFQNFKKNSISRFILKLEYERFALQV